MSMNLPMRDRPGKIPHQRLRNVRFSRFGKYPIVWVGLMLLAVVLAGIAVVVPMHASFRALVLVVVTGLLLACFGQIGRILMGSFTSRLSKQSQQATALTVTSARQRRRGWRLVNGACRDSGRDTDQVLVGPGGVFVIDSKWTTNICEIDDGTIVGLSGRDHVSRAQDAAHRVRRMLHHALPGSDMAVQPMIVVWGPGGLALDGGWTRIDGVLVCEGRKQQQWLGHLDTSELDQPAVERVSEALVSS
jgi:hypothetical protein